MTSLHQSSQKHFLNIHPSYLENLSHQERQDFSNCAQHIALTKRDKTAALALKQTFPSSYLTAPCPRLFLISIFAGLLILGWQLIVDNTPSFQLPDALATELPQAPVSKPHFEEQANQRCQQDIDLKFAAIANVLDYLLSSQQASTAQLTSEASASEAIVFNSQPKTITRSHQSAAIAGPPIRELPIIEVAVQKANLRIGPSLDHSPLMTVSSGTRLVVETEQNGWYRVRAPSGSPAWISSTVANPIS